MNTPHLAYSGWAEPVRQHVKVALLNPNVTAEEPAGRFFGMTMSGELTKWEEDGLLYVIWPAFTYWTQAGDDTFVRGKYLEAMKDGMDWLERRGWDEERGLFGRYHYCETPYAQSRGDGFDNATGAPTYPNDSQYEGTGQIDTVTVNGVPLEHTWQIPLSRVEPGDNTVQVKLSSSAEGRNVWIGSTVELHSVAASGGAVEYAVEAFGKNVLTFKNLEGTVEVADSAGRTLATKTIVVDDLSYVEFEGRGTFTVTRRLS